MPAATAHDTGATTVDVRVRDDLLARDDENCSIACTPIPGYGTD